MLPNSHLLAASLLFVAVAALPAQQTGFVPSDAIAQANPTPAVLVVDGKHKHSHGGESGSAGGVASYDGAGAAGTIGGGVNHHGASGSATGTAYIPGAGAGGSVGGGISWIEQRGHKEPHHGGASGSATGTAHIPGAGAGGSIGGGISWVEEGRHKEPHHGPVAASGSASGSAYIPGAGAGGSIGGGFGGWTPNVGHVGGPVGPSTLATITKSAQLAIRSDKPKSLSGGLQGSYTLTGLPPGAGTVGGIIYGTTELGGCIGGQLSGHGITLCATLPL